MPIAITQRKIASLKPSWTPFRGASILFASMGPVRTEGGNAAGDLFAELGQFADLPEHPWRTEYGFCPLPPDSYHVTLADLVHDGNLHEVPPVKRTQFGANGISAGCEYPAILAMAVGRSGLLTHKMWDFGVDRLLIMNRSALAMSLAPYDADAFTQLMAARDRLGAILLEQFGIRLQPYVPHVTIGYFANKDCADAAAADVEALDIGMRSRLEGRTFRFAPPAPYRFPDMAHYSPALTACAGPD